MGREIRKVPAGWQHPRDERTGEYLPLYDRTYEEALDEWMAGLAAWCEGRHEDQQNRSSEDPTYYEPTPRAYAEWHGDAPDSKYYRDAFDAPADHFQVYQTVSEGTPVSPVFASLEELGEWLIGQGHSAAAVQRFIERGWAPSGVYTGGQFYENIEALAAPGMERSDG